MLGLAVGRKHSVASHLSTTEDVVDRKISGATQWQLAAAAKAILAAQRNRKASIAVSVASDRKSPPPKGFVRKTAFYLSYAYKQWELRKFVLFLVLVIYAFVGGAIFYAIEHPVEVESLARAIQQRQQEAKNLTQQIREICLNFTISGDNSSAFFNCTFDLITGYQKHTGIMKDKLLWTYWNAVFYSGVTFATIGYGDTTTKTTGGRIATIIYATIGIPLMLAALRDLGLFLTDLFRLVHRKFSLIAIRKIWRRKKIAPQASIKGTSVRRNHVSVVEETLKSPWHSFADVHVPKEEDDIGAFNYPIVVAILIVILWIVCCAAIFQPWEDWTLFEGIYFFFVSLTTIGFGDIVPENRDIMLIFFWLVVIGLAMVTVLINLIQERIETIRNTASELLEKEIVDILARISSKEDADPQRKTTKMERRNST